eukprot:EC714251.1.p4 GENE.EC714251.1~~EC714251.1.p4  ORF type:complete len:55 (-),score=3.54 EC714251.1:317-481(-)
MQGTCQYVRSTPAGHHGELFTKKTLALFWRLLHLQGSRVQVNQCFRDFICLQLF